MNRPFLVGITGGIGSGKSVVSRIFGILGIPVYDADSRARELVATNGEIRKDIINLLGDEAYKGDFYNTTYVSSRVFDDAELLGKLNAVIHPAVAEDFSSWTVANASSHYIIKEAALLFESGSYKDLDKTILVSAPLELRIDRVLKRDSRRDRDQVENIIARQWDEEAKESLSDYVIRNGPEDLLIPQVLQLHQTFLAG